MNNRSTRLRQFTLGLGDITLLYVSLLATLFLRYGEISSHLINSHFLPFTILFVVWLIIYYSQGFYDLSLAKNNIDFWSSLLKATIINIAIGVAFFYFIPIFQITPKTNFIINITLFSALFILWRQLFNLLLRKEAFRTNTLFIGNSIEAQEIIAKIQSNPQLGYNAKLQISTKQINNAIELAAIINEHQIKVIVVADDPHANQKLAKILFQCLPFQINIYDLPVFYEKITGKIPINAINQMWFLENLVESEYGSYETIKRFLDIILATSFSIILLILSPIITVLVKLSSKGPIFYSQTRIGKNEKPFKLTKYRSMIHNAETNKPQWTTQGDSRVTTIGKFLRRTFLDELPQLFSIIKGEMSFVGPRPERPEFVEQLEKTIPFYQMRHIVKPGLTGWAQISYRYGSSVEDSTEKLKYDLYYIKNRSIALDIGIVLKTIKLIFKER